MPYCEPCDRYFSGDSAYYKHRQNSSRHLNYCVRCDRDFVSHAALTRHYTHSAFHNYCQWCQEDFDTADELDEHDDDYHYSCGSCNYMFRHEEQLDEHIEASHWYCKSCCRFFQNENNLQQHLNSNIHKAKDYMCPGRGCSRGFISWSALIKHFEAGTCPSGLNRNQLNRLVVQSDRNNIITNPSRLITGPKGKVEPAVSSTTWATERSYNGHMYECFLCHKEFVTLVSLNAHLQSPKHDERIYRCPNRNNCGSEFSALSALTSHVESGRCGVDRFKEVKAVMESLSRSVKRIGYY